MTKNLHFITYVLLFPAAIAVAEPKLVQGMSIIGNDESPNSLYIVPWKSAGVKASVKLSSDIMKEELEPVDKNAFIREIDYYNSSTLTSTTVEN